MSKYSLEEILDAVQETAREFGLNDSEITDIILECPSLNEILLPVNESLARVDIVLRELSEIETLPPELIFKILLENGLSKKDIRAFCSTNTAFSGFCRDEYFIKKMSKIHPRVSDIEKFWNTPSIFEEASYNLIVDLLETRPSTLTNTSIWGVYFKLMRNIANRLFFLPLTPSESISIPGFAFFRDLNENEMKVSSFIKHQRIIQRQILEHLYPDILVPVGNLTNYTLVMYRQASRIESQIERKTRYSEEKVRTKLIEKLQEFIIPLIIYDTDPYKKVIQKTLAVVQYFALEELLTNPESEFYYFTLAEQFNDHNISINFHDPENQQILKNIFDDPEISDASRNIFMALTMISYKN